MLDIAAVSQPGTAGPPCDQVFGRWLSVSPDPEVWPELEAAGRLERAGAAEEAVELLEEAIENHPRAASLFEARGAIYSSLGFPRAAAGDFQRAADLTPARGETWFALGRTYQELALSRQALEALGRALELGLDSSEVHLASARAYRSLGRRGKAAGHYHLALAREPSPPTELLVEAASLATECPDSGPGVGALAQALSKQNGDGTEGAHSTETWFVRALLLESSGETAETIAGYLRALEIDSRTLVDWTELALLSIELGDPETSAGAAERVLASQSDPARRKALEKLLAGRAGR